ncbi:hypothetical protein M1271_05150 [Patescibacteria group bacterium]|nr:hypothetical protein [Patescibacteria group bacterium]MCL5797918.1 hypothetical protein [Patescibacteria group bacterium]
MANLQNKINAVTNTGFNYADLNTLNGQVSTGNTQSAVNLLNKLNSNITGVGGFSTYNVYGTQTGDIVFQTGDPSVGSGFSNASPTVSKNSVTGAGSSNDASANNSFTVKEANGNDAQLVNDINLQAVTGQNSASYNTGNGTVQTGNATALGNIINMVNSNLNVSNWLMGVVNIYGTLAGNIVLPWSTENSTGNVTASNTGSAGTNVTNDTTGALSTNNATSNTSDSTNFTNNNTADIASTVNATANTGNNTASINTGGGSVTTGNSNTSVSNSTVANTNAVDENGTVWLVIVNDMGKWVGYIMGAPWGATSASNGLPVQQTGGGGSGTYTTDVSNSGTGALSTNNATYNSTSDTSIANNNNAGIVNNITANADTGNNKAQYNTGAGQIQTGNAQVGLNLVNLVNTNVTAKNFAVLLVNVFGNFLGNVVTPGQNYNQTTAAISGDTNNSGTTGSNNNLQGTISPTPTLDPLPSFNTADTNIGGVNATNQTADSQNYSQTYYSYYYPTDTSGSQTQQQQQAGQTQYYYPPSYYQASANVANQRYRLANQAQDYLQQDPQTYILGQNNGQNRMLRGSFVSPAFAKATETSFAGMLLGGAKLNVNESWLSIVPLAFFLILIRRRKRFHLGKYVNALLEVLL